MNKKIDWKNKNNLLIIAGIVIIAIILIILFLCFSSKKTNKVNPETLEKELTDIGSEFYENQYYANLSEEDKKKLELYNEDGININISNLEVVISLPEKVAKALESKECNKEKTKMIIYPKSPYGVKDYEIKIELSCKK